MKKDEGGKAENLSKAILGENAAWVLGKAATNFVKYYGDFQLKK